jgi:hypothetical protein
VIWFFFIRDDEALQREAKREAHSGDYVLTIDADGAGGWSVFAMATALRRRLVHEERRLEADCWVLAGRPVVMAGTDRR